jgi:hypothetical protein
LERIGNGAIRQNRNESVVKASLNQLVSDPVFFEGREMNIAGRAKNRALVMLDRSTATSGRSGGADSAANFRLVRAPLCA